MKTFIKPSGVEVEVNPNSYDLAESLGWKPKDEKPPVDPELEAARAVYKEKLGKAPHHNLGLEKIKEAIEAKIAEDEAEAKAKADAEKAAKEAENKDA